MVIFSGSAHALCGLLSCDSAPILLRFCPDSATFCRNARTCILCRIFCRHYPHMPRSVWVIFVYAGVDASISRPLWWEAGGGIVEIFGCSSHKSGRASPRNVDLWVWATRLCETDLCGCEQRVSKHQWRNLQLPTEVVFSIFSLHIRVAVIQTAQVLTCAHTTHAEEPVPSRTQVRAACTWRPLDDCSPGGGLWHVRKIGTATQCHGYAAIQQAAYPWVAKKGLHCRDTNFCVAVPIFFQE